MIDRVARGVLQLHHLNSSWDDKTLVFEIEKVLGLSRSKDFWVRIWFLRTDEESGTRRATVWMFYLENRYHYYYHYYLLSLLLLLLLLCACLTPIGGLIPRSIKLSPIALSV